MAGFSGGALARAAVALTFSAALVASGGSAFAATAAGHAGASSRTPAGHAQPHLIGPGSCDGASGSAVGFWTEGAGGPAIYCYAGHGTSNIRIYDVTVFTSSFAANGWFISGANCNNITAFKPNNTIKWTLGINVCSFHLN